MIKTILGVFKDEDDAEAALNDLKAKGFNPKDISIIMRSEEAAREFADDTGTSVGEGAISGATTGAALGGVLGLLVGIGTITLPGIGGLLIGGPIASALGLTGAAATTVSGAATGALAGGVLGALMGLGLSRDEAEVYEQHIKEGGILVAVPAHSENDDIVTDVLQDHGADQIRTISHRGAEETKEVSEYYRNEYDDYNHAYAIGAKGGRTQKKKKMNRG